MAARRRAGTRTASHRTAVNTALFSMGRLKPAPTYGAWGTWGPASAGPTWWRADRRELSHGTLTALEGSDTAFYALLGFTFVLLLSPQAWFPVLKLIRIALLAGGIAIAAHVLDRTAHRQAITP